MNGQVVFEDGVYGEVWPELLATGDETYQTRIRLADGRQVVLPTYLLVPQDDGTYRVRMRTTEIGQPQEESLPENVPQPLDEKHAIAEETVIPVIEEFAQIGKRMVETGQVHVTTTVTSHEEVIDQPLMRTTAEVTHIPIGRMVDAVPEPRREGDTLVISVVEEVLVVEKRLMLVEEVRVTQRQSEYSAPQIVTLRRQEVSVERMPSAEE